MHTWQYDEQLHFEFSSLRLENEPELAAAVRSLLSEVIRAQSFLTIPGSKAYMLRDDQVPPGIVGQAVQRLAEHNILVRVSSRDAGWASSLWKMTQHGLSTVRAAYKLHSPRPMFSPPDPSDIHAQSTVSVLQLMLHLRQEGWECCEKVRGARAPEPYKPGPDATKVWWIKPGSESGNIWFYLMALATVQTHGKEVPHLSSQGTYKQILGLEDQRAARAQKLSNGSLLWRCKKQACCLCPRPRPKPKLDGGISGVGVRMRMSLSRKTTLSQMLKWRQKLGKRRILQQGSACRTPLHPRIPQLHLRLRHVQDPLPILVLAALVLLMMMKLLLTQTQLQGMGHDQDIHIRQLS